MDIPSNRLANLSPAKRALLERRLRNHLPASPPPSIRRTADGVPAPLSFAQQRMWFLDKLDPGNLAYTIPYAYQLIGCLDAEAFRRSLQEIVCRHDVLRTTFQARDSEQIQVIAPPGDLGLHLVDLSPLSASDREAEARRLMTAHIQTRFDLMAGPLLQAKLLRLGEQDHLLLLNVHHILFDGWSIEVFRRELHTLYNAFREGRPVSLPDLPIQYADYAIWQRTWLQGEVLERQLAYWRRQLRGAPAVLELPTDHPRPPLASFRGAEHAVVFDVGLSQALQDLSRQEGVTLFMTLLAAFQVLLSRYSGQEDIVVGTPIAGRTRPEFENLLGLFVNTLALRTDLSGNPTFRELLNRVREMALEAYAYQDLPFERLLEELQPERSLRHSPLFQVLFVLQNTPYTPLELTGLTVRPLDFESVTAKFDLTLFLVEKASGACQPPELRGRLEYSTDLFEPATIARLLGHFHVLLAGIVANPEQRLAQLPLLTDAERQQLLIDWNRTEADYPRDANIHQLFEAQVARTPEAVAIVCDEQELSYRELNARANQLAHHLRGLGVGPETRVGLCLERSVEMVVGLLGILKAGGAYVPLDPEYPKERLAFLLQDSRVAVLLTQQCFQLRLPAYEIPVVYLDAAWERFAEHSSANPFANATADNLAYVTYTSGSTGTPKGVAIPHRAVVRLLFGGHYVQLDLSQIFLQLSPLSFDASTFELWGSLLHGARCVLFPGRLPLPHDLGRILAEHRVSTLWLTAALFNLVMDEAPDILQGVRQLLIGGEALSVSHVQRALERLPATQIINGYGPTEGTTFTCCYPIPRTGGDFTGSIPIGRPISNTPVYVLDRHLQPVPIGVPGELYIGGDGLARGYANRPEWTAERFIPHPFSTEGSARLYRTGDRVRWRPDGNLEYLGRLDHQIKLRGFRIEPGEIEAALAQHPQVRASIVRIRADQSADKRLVAYVVPRQEPGPAPAELRAFLEQKLPWYMTPAAFVLQGQLPLTTNGKVDDHALLQAGLIRNGDSPASRDCQPHDSIEARLVEIWQKLLHIERIGVHDSFFELGGHSLTAIRLFAQIESTFGKRLPLSSLFHGPTIAQLGDRIRGSAPSRDDSLLVPLQPAGSRLPFFCVHGVGGEVLFLKPLARLLGPEQPFFGLRARGSAADAQPDRDIATMATRYLEAIRHIAPHGPYQLGGYSAGGTIAYEMAQQLYAQGEEVALLAIFDTSPPNLGPATRSGPHVRFGRFLHNLPYWVWEDVLQSNATQLLNRARGTLADLWRRTRRLCGASNRQDKELNIRAVFGVADLPAEYQRFLSAQYQALCNYHARPYPGRLTLFRARARPLFRADEPDLNWAQLAAGGVDIQRVPGCHSNLFVEPFVREVAHALQARLRSYRLGT